MTQLVWGKIGERAYETGVDRGVLYLSDGTGVPWNGLTSVEENFGESTTPFYLDGVKYVDVPNIEDYEATISALTYPDEFLEYDGVASLGGGLYASDQQSKRFGLSYRTLVGDDAVGLDKGYKIHLVYNLTAEISDRSFNTLTEQTAPMEFSWNVTAVPQYLSEYRPTAHVILDTTRLNHFLVSVLEGILYGDSANNPRLPSLTELRDFVMGWDLFTVTDNGDGTWTATGPDELIVMNDPTTFTISEISSTFLDADTYTITTTES